MRKLFLVLPIILAHVVTVQATDSKTLTRTIQAGNIDTLELDSGIGDITMTARDGLEEIVIEVELTPRRGGIFSSKRRAERDVEAASLETVVERDSLELRIDAPHDDEDRRFEERWIVDLPSRLMVKLAHGVGDVVIKGIAAGLELDSGVGDVTIEAVDGAVTIDLGVGTALVRAPAAAYASAESESGVGSARLTVFGEDIESEGFVSKAASWSGGGSSYIEVSVGVGDAIVRLE